MCEKVNAFLQLKFNSSNLNFNIDNNQIDYSEHLAGCVQENFYSFAVFDEPKKFLIPTT